MLTDKGRTILARAKRLVATKHEARLNALLGEADRTALLRILDKLTAF
jgi:DNA-binding MarR family transcriptional regulator